MRNPINVESVVPVERFALRAVVALVLTAAVGTAFAVLALAVRLNWAPVRELDQAVADALNGAVSGNCPLIDSLHRVTALGGTAMLLWLVGVGVVWLLVRRQPWVATYVAVTALGAAVLGVVLKDLVERLRPVVDAPVAAASGPSFPSGHALSSLVSYGVLVLVFLPTVHRSLRWVLIGAAALLVVVVGVTRMALGVHFLTDVIGGWLLGALWLTLTAVAFRKWRAEAGVGQVPLSAGLAPEATPDLRPALVLYTATALLVFRATRRWWRWLFVATAVLAPLLVTVQRLYIAAHYPTDLLGSLLPAAAWTAITWWVVRPDRAWRVDGPAGRSPRDQPPEPTR